MTEAVVFAVVFVGFFILRFVAATIFFYLIMDEGPGCPICGGETLRVQAPVLERTARGIRSSWCPDCGWEGWLRVPSAQPPAATYSESQPGQPPGISKKSS